MLCQPTWILQCSVQVWEAFYVWLKIQSNKDDKEIAENWDSAAQLMQDFGPDRSDCLESLQCGRYSKYVFQRARCLSSLHELHLTHKTALPHAVVYAITKKHTKYWKHGICCMDGVATSR